MLLNMFSSIFQLVVINCQADFVQISVDGLKEEVIKSHLTAI